MVTTAAGGGTRRPAVFTIGLVAATAVALALLPLLGPDGPPVIRLAGTGDSGTTMAEQDAAMDIGRAQGVGYRFELTDAAGFDAGEATAWRLEPPADLAGATAELAAHLGLDAEVAPLPDTDGYQAGDDGFSSPVLWVGATGDFNYHDPTAGGRAGCVEPAEPDPGAGGDQPDGDGHLGDPGDTVAGSEGEQGQDEPDATRPLREPVPCEPEAPPADVPTVEEARRAAGAFFAGLGLHATPHVEEVGADEWGAWVNATLPAGDRPSDLELSVVFGADAVVTAAHGTLARPVAVDRYPTLDAAGAVERLEAEQGVHGVAEPAMEGGPDTGVDPDTPVSSSDDDATTRPDPAPGGEPEIHTVTLVGAEPVTLLTIGAEQTMWLLPAVRFTDDEGGDWRVLTVPDDYLEQADGAVDPGVEPLPMPEPGPVPDPASPPGQEPGGEPDQPEPGAPAPETERAARDAVGRPEDEAVAHIEEAGLVARIVMRDGEAFAVTDDFRPDRVDLVVEDGLVVDAKVG